MSPSAEPPSPQEIQRKLSVHSAFKSKETKSIVVPTIPLSGTESESDAALTPSISSAHHSGQTGGLLSGTALPPLSSIAELRTGSGEDSEDDVEAGWETTDIQAKARGSLDEGVIKAGYLWKKGERRKNWKKRWFVLRPAHLAYYKTSAEYQLLRLLDLSEVHSCTKVNLKKHENTFGLVSPVRTFYLQANSQVEVQEWVNALEDARHALMATSTQNSIAGPIPIPNSRSRSNSVPLTPSPPGTHPTYIQNVTSSDSDEPTANTITISPHNRDISSSPTKPCVTTAVDPAKTIVSGYLMKCGSKRRNWRKRWFTLTSEKLVYFGSHMDTKPHRTFPFSEILDALEYDLPTNRYNPTLISASAASSPPHPSTADDADDAHRTHSFKIVTTKRTLLLCAPSEEEEIRWLGAVRALIARRTGAGVVPGESTSTTSPDIAPSSSGGLKGKARRRSVNADDGDGNRLGRPTL